MLKSDPFEPQRNQSPQLGLNFDEPRQTRRIWPVRELVGQVRELVEQDPAITNRLPAGQLVRTFQFERQLANVDAIFDRVLA